MSHAESAVMALIECSHISMSLQAFFSVKSEMVNVW